MPRLIARSLVIGCALLIVWFCATFNGPVSRAEESSDSARHAAFKKSLTNVALVGYFTDDSELPTAEPGDKLPKVAGKVVLQEERYDILSVTKLPAGKLWLIQTRIRYGDHDLTVPLPIPVEWAGETAVITVDQVTIPGLGTFDARVLIEDGRYAGTWRHESHGGHLFGRIESLDK